MDLGLPPELVTLCLLGRVPGLWPHRVMSVYKPALETLVRVCSANMPGVPGAGMLRCRLTGKHPLSKIKASDRQQEASPYLQIPCLYYSM